MTATPSSALGLDFEALLSREFQPARITRIVPKPTTITVKKVPPKRTTVNSQRIDHDSQLLKDTSRLVLELVSQTPDYQKHLPPGRRPEISRLLQAHAPPPPKKAPPMPPPQFHPVEITDWESKIMWEIPEDFNPKCQTPQELLQQRRNPYLDNITFEPEDIGLEGNIEELKERASKVPLILELGVAGRSVAKHVYQNTTISAQRPTPATQSEEYQRRVARDWDDEPNKAEVKHSRQQSKEKLEAIIEARQKKRAQMAKDKTNRVSEAMGTMALGGGRGRTVTSSLMGPGGTERSGRPSRRFASMSYDVEYIEQLDMVMNHSLVRDLSKVLLRQFHRPKLPLNVVRVDMSWQLQIRHIPSSGGDKKNSPPGASGSYQSIFLGSNPGAVSKAKLRTESDLSPSEGKLVVLEYSEEKPPIYLSKGMASKIVNYYRGDKSQCPVSAGGGDRPARRKRVETSKDGDSKSLSRKNIERLPRLEGPNRPTTITDWIGKMPKRAKERTETEAIDVIPEGATELLHPKVHGPFIGEIEDGMVVTGLVSNMFVAPMFRHEPDSTDFLMILTPPSGATRPGQRESMGVILRDFPNSIFTVGQTEPRVRVNAPGTQGEKTFIGPFISYQIARAISKAQLREGHGLRFDELHHCVLPNMEIPSNALRQRLKQVAIYDKNTQIWTTKPVGVDDYPGVDALGKTISPEGVSAFESACAAGRRLSDLGIQQLYTGSHTVVSVGVAMVYLAGQLNAAKELSRKTKKLLDLSKANKQTLPTTVALYEKAAAELDAQFKYIRQKYEIAKYIYEELQLTPWHLTSEFIDIHVKGEGTGMMKLTGIGDPSGTGESFSFLREADSKPSRSLGEAALKARVKKITGTDCDLRKLFMKPMAAILRSYGLDQKYIDTLKRWDRVHIIRDLSTMAASDGIGDGLERFARGEKIKLSEQKEVYRKRIQVIWKRQIASLSMDTSDKSGGVGEAGIGAEGDVEAGAATQKGQPKSANGGEKEDSDSDSEDDDDFAAELEESLMDRNEATQLVANQNRGGGEDSDGLNKLRAAASDREAFKEATDFAAWRRQREEETSVQERLQAAKPAAGGYNPTLMMNRKVIRKKIVKTHPDGRQTTTFKFILHPDTVRQTMTKLQDENANSASKRPDLPTERDPEDTIPGHSFFEDEDDPKGKRRSSGRRRGTNGRILLKAGSGLQFGKLKTKISQEERMRKRKREEEELEVYSVPSKLKGTNNRRERGSIRDRRPHVIFAEKLESIRSAVEGRPYASPFLKPVDRRLLPTYYETISHPIDLQTIRDKISRYEYRLADSLVRDFELMKNNAVKFNGPSHVIAQEAVAIYDFVKDQVEATRSELAELEKAVEEQMGAKPKKKKAAAGTKKKEKKKKAAVAPPPPPPPDDDDIDLNLDSGDDSYSGLLDM